jgi:predicted dehydrogenase
MQVVRDLGFDIVGICDQNRETLATAAGEFSIATDRQFADLGTMLKQEPELVVIATTAPTHAAFTVAAAEAGVRAVLCEKPMATSLADCDRMIAVCQQRGVRLAINHQMRFMQQYTEPRALLESPAFGGLTSVTVVAGNFGLSMNGTHYVEMFRYMTGEAPLEVTAWFSRDVVPNPRGPQFEDRAGCLRMTTPSGKRFFLDCSADQGHGVRAVYGARNGQITIDELSGTLTEVSREEQYRELPTTRYGMPVIEKHRKIPPADAVTPTRAVLRALVQGVDYPSGQDGRLAVAALVAAHVSVERGNVAVGIDDQLPANRSFPWA